MARIRLDFEVRPARAQKRPDDGSPMRIVVLGDFGGRAQRGAEDHRVLAARRPVRIDIDNFDRVMARIAPGLELSVAGESGIALEFATIDDFHPDTLHRRVPLFQRLRDTPMEPDSQTFARLVGPIPVAPPTASPYVQALLDEAVAPHVVPGPQPHEAVHAAVIDAALAARMRAIVQDPHFKALEALWRGVHWLVSSLETDERLQIFVLDATRGELVAESEALRGALGAEPWSLIVGDYSFGGDDEDLGLLARLGAIASQAGAPFLAAGQRELIEPDERWNAVRESIVAPWIGLAQPRVLLRRPYGKTSDPVESFAFEEIAPPHEHDAYLWGSGAFACALLIGRAFSLRGWDMEPGDELELDDLPAHTYDDDGEKRLKPCAEVNLLDREAEAMLEAGLMPLLSHKNRNVVRLMRFQSIAKPAQALAGPWAIR